MIKKLIYAALIALLILNGCGNSSPINTSPKTLQSPLETAISNSVGEKSQGTNTATKAPTKTPTATYAPSDLIDYNQYVKKVWVVKNSINDHDDNYPSFHISKIANGEISGKFSLFETYVPNSEYNSPNDSICWGYFNGIVDKDAAYCQFNVNTGDTANVKLVFKPNGGIEATFKYKYKSKEIKDYSMDLSLHLDGTFQFNPYNLSDFKFRPFKNQSFKVDLNSWGNVKFVSGQCDTGKHILTEFYLTNEDGDILYSFGSPFPYGVDVKAVSFQDVNKDGLKDVIIIAFESDDNTWHRACVFFQKVDGSFNIDDKLNQEINDSGNNKYIKTITDYLDKEF